MQHAADALRDALLFVVAAALLIFKAWPHSDRFPRTFAEVMRESSLARAWHLAALGCVVLAVARLATGVLGAI